MPSELEILINCRVATFHLSASQFRREYSRFFGNALAKDIVRLRQDALGLKSRKYA